MRPFHVLVTVSAGIAAGLLQGTALAQNCDPATDVVLSSLSGEQVQPKIVGIPDGGAFVSWFDNSSGGYDVRLQRVDSDWNEAFATNGMLIADRGFSSTQDYDLAVDASWAALLAFRDDRFGGTRITAQRVGSNGAMPWGENGIQFANGTDFVAAPKIAGTGNGAIVVGWTNERELRFQRLDAAGNVLWPNDVIISDPDASLSLCDVEATILDGRVAGDVIVSWVRSESFFSPRHLYAQRLDANGNFVWGSHVAVFDGGSLQLGNFPPLTADHAGGAIFAWYDTSSSLQCLVQHLDENGQEAFAHNGVAVSTNGAQDRVSPAAAYDRQTDDIYVFWMEQRNAQSERGVYGQRLDRSGTRRWGEHGVVVRPVAGSVDYRSINALYSSGRAMVSFIESAGFGNDQVRAAGLDAAGTMIWSPAIADVTPGGLERSRLVSAMLAAPGRVGLVWQHDNPADIHGQAIRVASGTLGTAPIDLTLSGTCPGLIRVTARDATPGGQVAFVYARGAGRVRNPNGMLCHGVQLCLDTTAILGANWIVDGSGVSSIVVDVPARACGGRILIQAIDLSTCTTSRAVPTP